MTYEIQSMTLCFDSLNMIYCQNTLTKFYVQVQYLCQTKTLKVVYLSC